MESSQPSPWGLGMCRSLMYFEFGVCNIDKFSFLFCILLITYLDKEIKDQRL